MNEKSSEVLLGLGRVRTYGAATLPFETQWLRRAIADREVFCRDYLLFADRAVVGPPIGGAHETYHLDLSPGIPVTAYRKQSELELRCEPGDPIRAATLAILQFDHPLLQVWWDNVRSAWIASELERLDALLRVMKLDIVDRFRSFGPRKTWENVETDLILGYRRVLQVAEKISELARRPRVFVAPHPPSRGLGLPPGFTYQPDFLRDGFVVRRESDGAELFVATEMTRFFPDLSGYILGRFNVADRDRAERDALYDDE